MNFLKTTSEEFAVELTGKEVRGALLALVYQRISAEDRDAGVKMADSTPLTVAVIDDENETVALLDSGTNVCLRVEWAAEQVSPKKVLK